MRLTEPKTALVAASPHGKEGAACEPNLAGGGAGALPPFLSCHGTAHVACPMQPKTILKSPKNPLNPETQNFTYAKHLQNLRLARQTPLRDALCSNSAPRPPFETEQPSL